MLFLQTTATGCELTSPQVYIDSYSRIVLCRTFNMYLWQISLAGNSQNLIGHLLVTFGGAPNLDVADTVPM